MLAAKALSLSLFPLSLSLSLYLFFYLVRDKKEEDKIDSRECGRQRLRQREASADSNSICRYRTEE